jgi:hypothetical protein
LKEYAESLFRKHARSGILLDANLLLLLVLGGARVELIGSFKRLNMFAADDYTLLDAIVSRFAIVATTPNVLTEVSNLADGVGGAYRDDYLAAFAKRITVLDERYVASAAVLTSPAFAKFGLTDAVIAEIASRDLLVMTIDLPLYQYLATMGLDVLNFNHLRPYYWT